MVLTATSKGQGGIQPAGNPQYQAFFSRSVEFWLKPHLHGEDLPQVPPGPLYPRDKGGGRLKPFPACPGQSPPRPSL